MSDQEVDNRPGFYYVSAIEGARAGVVRGPFINDHAGALAAVEEAREETERHDARASWYAFGTCRSQIDLGPGWLDSLQQETSMVGRPKSEHPLRYQVRHTDAQMTAWQAAAKAEDRELQNWIRRTLDAAARKAARKTGR